MYPVLEQCTNRGLVHGCCRRESSAEAGGCQGAQDETDGDGRAAHDGEIVLCMLSNNV